MKRLILLAAIVLLPILAIAGQVGPPELVGLQGRLTDNSGNNVPDGNYTMIFRIYDAPTGGNLSWAETSSVAVSGGLFNVNLGSAHALDADIFNSVDPDWLEITVNGEVLSSRMQIVSNPYSQNTARVTGDIQTGPGEIVFVGIGGQPDLPTGIIFQDTSTGDTMAQYGPGGAVFQPVSPPELPIMASYGPGGVVFIPVAPPELPVAAFHPLNGIMFADTGTGDTMAQYGPGEVVYTGIGGTPDVAKYGLDGFLHNSPTGSGFVKIEDTDAAPGDGVVDRTEYKLFGVTSFDGTKKLAEYGPGGAVLTKTSGVDPLFLVADGATGDTLAKLGAGGLVMDLGPNHLELGAGGLVMDTGPNHTRYGPSGMYMTNASGDTEIYVTPTFVRVCEPMSFEEAGSILMIDASGDTNVQISNTIFRHCEPMTADSNAGSSQAVQVGERWRDNSIVAWGRVTATGSLTNDFGVASVTRNSAGNYTITLDAAASLAGNLITTAAPELDTPPTSAAAARILYVNQLGISPFNKVDIYITNGSFAATDNDFLFIVTAR